MLGLLVFWLLVRWPLHNPHPAAISTHGVLAIRAARIYVSPDAPPLEPGIVIARDGLITAVGSDVAIPSDAAVIACDSCTVTAGFWNAHVHFTQPKWDYAIWKSAGTLDTQLADMLTSRGFTTVVDAGSDPRITLSLRRRIESGELNGPAIYTAGAALYPPKGLPYYLSNLPALVRWLLPQPGTPDEAVSDVERNITRGSDILKLFTGSIVEPGHVLPMPEPVARAAADAAHRHGQLVFSHPSDLAGTLVAIHAGVDVLAHAPSDARGIDSALLRDVAQRRMAMIPTLKMFGTTVTTSGKFLDPIYAEVREFHSLGGELLFGTDVGYMTDYTTGGEFEALRKSGLDWREMLRMLTAAPARRFGVTANKGSIAVGKDADLVVIDGDPAGNIGAFSRVRWTIRKGRVLYAATP